MVDLKLDYLKSFSENLFKTFVKFMDKNIEISFFGSVFNAKNMFFFSKFERFERRIF